MAEKYYYETNTTWCFEKCLYAEIDTCIGSAKCIQDCGKQNDYSDSNNWIDCPHIEQATGKTEQELIKEGKLIIE